MTDEEFWKSTPRKIFALLDYHIKYEKSVNGISDNPKKIENEKVKKMSLSDFMRMGGVVKK